MPARAEIEPVPIEPVDGVYQISEPGHLVWFRNVINDTSDSVPNTASALLLNDIDISDEENWTPIGTEYNDYAGTFDGGGYKISGLKITSPDGWYIGLFRYVGGSGTVKNLTVENADIDITTYSPVGIIAGRNDGTIENCTVGGSVQADMACEGIAGDNSGTIRNCRNDAAITSSEDTAGRHLWWQ